LVGSLNMRTEPSQILLDAGESFAPENMKIHLLKFLSIVVIIIAALEIYRSIAAHTESHLVV